MATDLDVVDAKGNAVTNAADSTHIELAIRLTVTSKRVLRTSLKSFPDTIVLTYGHGFILSVSAEKERLLGKEMYYLLSGPHFQPVHALQFFEPISAGNEIDQYLKEKSHD